MNFKTHRNKTRHRRHERWKLGQMTNYFKPDFFLKRRDPLIAARSRRVRPDSSYSDLLLEANVSKLSLQEPQQTKTDMVEFGSLVSNTPTYGWLGRPFESGEQYYPALMIKSDLKEYELPAEMGVQLFPASTTGAIFEFSDPDRLALFGNPAKRLSLFLNADRITGLAIREENKFTIQISSNQMIQCIEELFKQTGSSYLISIMESLTTTDNVRFPGPPGLDREGEIVLIPFAACYNGSKARYRVLSIQERIDNAKRLTLTMD